MSPHLEEMLIRIELEAMRREITAILGYRPW